MWSEKRADCSPGSFRLQSVTGTHSSPPQSFCHAERLNEEPDMGKPFVRFCEGLRHNWCMGEILWHRRETRRQTENTNVTPTALEDLILYGGIDQITRQVLILRIRLDDFIRVDSIQNVLSADETSW